MLEQSKMNMFKELFLKIKNQLLTEEPSLEEFSIGDEADLAVNTNENQLILKMRSRKKFYLKKIEAALKKIDRGTFGECEDCGISISKERLVARPTATLCINCKEEQEGLEQHIVYAKKSATMGKEMILPQLL